MAKQPGCQLEGEIATRIGLLGFSQANKQGGQGAKTSPALFRQPGLFNIYPLQMSDMPAAHHQHDAASIRANSGPWLRVPSRPGTGLAHGRGDIHQCYNQALLVTVVRSVTQARGTSARPWRPASTAVSAPKCWAFTDRTQQCPALSCHLHRNRPSAATATVEPHTTLPQTVRQWWRHEERRVRYSKDLGSVGASDTRILLAQASGSAITVR